jgi:DNA-binding MarR family transcriptional regulator
MSRFKKDSLELRILELVRDNYPITTEDLRKELKVSKTKLDLALKRLEKMGYLDYDVLPDKVYIRLRVIPVGPEARKSKKKAEKKRKRKRDKRGEPPERDDFSYV